MRCARRSAISPDLRARVVLTLLVLAGGCSRDARSVRLPAVSPSDEIYRISCEGSIRACRDEASELCGGRYEVLQSTGAARQPPRVTSAPGPASTGPRYQRPKWVGELIVACGGAAPRLPGEGPETPARSPASTAGAATPRGGRACVPGLTQECLGPGACRGAQACLPDGMGYGPCDCGGDGVLTRPERDAGTPGQASGE